MNLLLIITAFFAYLLFKELFSGAERGKGGVDILYSLGLCVAIVASAWYPYQYHKLQQDTARVSDGIAKISGTKIRCNTMIDSIYDPDLVEDGGVEVDEQKITFKVGECDQLLSFVKKPTEATFSDWYVFHQFVNYAVQIGGEEDLVLAECKALQRSVDVASQFGVPQSIAHARVADYYNNEYRDSPLYTKQCREGRRYDENIAGAPWDKPKVSVSLVD